MAAVYIKENLSHFLRQYQEESGKDHGREKPEKRGQKGCNLAVEDQGSSQQYQEAAQDVLEDPYEDSVLCKGQPPQPHQAQEAFDREAEEDQRGDQEDDKEEAAEESSPSAVKLRRSIPALAYVSIGGIQNCCMRDLKLPSRQRSPSSLSG